MKSFGITSPVKYLFLSAAIIASFSPCAIWADGDASKEEKIEVASQLNEASKKQNEENKAAVDSVANKSEDATVVEDTEKNEGLVSAYVIAPVVAGATFVATYTGLKWLYNCDCVLPFITGAAAGVVAKTAYDAYIEDEIDFDC